MTEVGGEDLPISYTVYAVRDLPEFRQGDDLVESLAQSAPALTDGDILVVTSKIISKIEGRLLDVAAGEAQRQRARDEAIDGESLAVVAQRGQTRIVRNRLGLTMAAAGIDASNVPDGKIALLPEDPDASAEEIRTSIRVRLGRDVAVVITDTVGRPWREGLVDIAIGSAGISPLRDLRGTVDTHGHPLAVTALAQIDEIASASELVRGKVGAIPVAVVRGIPWQTSDLTARSLIRAGETDMFSLGTRDVVPATRSMPTSGNVDSALVEAAVDAVPQSSAIKAIATGRAISVESDLDPFFVGVYVGKLLVALRAEGLAGTLLSASPVQIEVSRASAYEGRTRS